MALRRGFKTEANFYAKEFRMELGRKAYESLCPWELADYLSIPILKLTEFSEENVDAVDLLTSRFSEEFSAVSVFKGRKRVIVHNDVHHPFRQAANIAHELGHAILMHPPTPPFNAEGNRNYSIQVKSLEDEANWLGPALLVSEDAALHIVRKKMNMSEASQKYGVSEQLIQMRINVTGAQARVYRYKKGRRG